MIKEGNRETRGGAYSDDAPCWSVAQVSHTQPIVQLVVQLRA